MDRGAWWAAVPGVTEADMTERLTLSLHFHDSLRRSSSCHGVCISDSKLPALPKYCSLPTGAQRPPQDKPLTYYGDIWGHSQYSNNGSVYCSAISNWGIKNQMEENDRREACAGTNEEDFQEGGTGWTGPLPARTNRARFLGDSLPTTRGGLQSLKERERWQGSVSEGCLERAPRGKLRCYLLCYWAWGHSVLPQTRGSHLITTKRLRNVVEWSTEEKPKHVSPGSVPLHERTLWTHTDTCDGPHEGLGIKGGRGMTAFLGKLMTW